MISGGVQYLGYLGCAIFGARGYLLRERWRGGGGTSSPLSTVQLNTGRDIQVRGNIRQGAISGARGKRGYLLRERGGGTSSPLSLQFNSTLGCIFGDDRRPWLVLIVDIMMSIDYEM